MNDQLSRIRDYFDTQITDCNQRHQQLAEDGRNDEAVFEKVEANIYDIFRTVYTVALNTRGDDMPAVKTFFNQRIEQLPRSWAVSYAKAEEYNDHEKMHMEQLKLATVEQIRTHISAIWEESE